MPESEPSAATPDPAPQVEAAPVAPQPASVAGRIKEHDGTPIAGAEVLLEIATDGERDNVAKATLLYDCLDAIPFYSSPVAKEDRSRMNVPFRLADDALDAKFLAEAEALGLSQLKGHRSVGGMRASIYNAMPMEGVAALVGFLEDFARRHG